MRLPGRNKHLKDLNVLYDLALQKENLSIALKVKELLMKACITSMGEKLELLSPENLDQLIHTIEMKIKDDEEPLTGSLSE